MLDQQSSLYRFAPNAVVLAIRTDQAAPELWRDFADLAPEAVEQAAERVKCLVVQLTCPVLTLRLGRVEGVA